MHYLEDLNKEQREAVETTSGAVLVLAGAGSGKTRVITKRILHLVAKGLATPEEILSITFTNKAAGEMKERATDLLRKELGLGAESEDLYISTFHSFGLELLKRYGKYVGIQNRPSIYDRQDSLKIIKDAMKSLDIDPKTNPPGKFLSVMSKHKGNGLGFHDLEGESPRNPFEAMFLAIWQKYQERLKEENALDFDDLLLKPYQLLKGNKGVRESCLNSFKFIQIDEYQDTNRVQYYIAKLLAGHGNLFVVGDADQNIYSWRGARLENILGFREDFPEAKLINLSINYRSTQNIVNLSEKIIEKNTKRLPKEVKTINADGEPVRIFAAQNEQEEAEYIAGKTLDQLRDGVPADEVAVLYRTHFQSRVLEEAFLKENIPYQVIGVKFFERKEVKDVLSFIEASLNPESKTCLSRIINVPPRGIGKVTLLKILAGRELELGPQMQAKVSKFRELLTDIRHSAETNKPSETLRLVIERSGMKKLLEEGDDEDRERLLNIEELVTLAQKYDDLTPMKGIEKLLEEASLSTKEEALPEDEVGSVKLLTVHSAKGLEFETVFIAGLEEGLFPIARDDDSLEEMEEERRLFYVAATRAKKRLFLSYAHSRLIYGKREFSLASQFIADVESMLEAEEFAMPTFYLD